MTSLSPIVPSIQYPLSTVHRAERAMRCAPFQLHLFACMVDHSVALLQMVGPSGLQQRYTRKALSERTAEAELLWLIQVGLLRREVDGQGLTDSFRVTPLGRQLVQKWSQAGQTRAYAPSIGDRFYNALNRWLRVRI
jgi:hypothetical protein